MGLELEFAPIYQEFRPKIVRYLTRLVGSGEAEDLAQEVFIKVCRGLKEFRGESGLSTWIYRIATNVAMDRLRSVSSKRSLEGEPATCALSEDHGEDAVALLVEKVVEKAPSAEIQLIRGEMNTCIRDVVAQLPEAYRAVIVLSELKEFRNSEIAEILGLSLETVKMRLHRGRGMLRKSLSAQCCLFRNEENELACVPKSTGPAP